MKTHPLRIATLAALAVLATAGDGIGDDRKPPSAESKWEHARVAGAPVINDKPVRRKTERTSVPAAALAPGVHGDQIQQERGQPSEEDWKNAPAASVARDVRDDCGAQALGEWLRVTCSGRAGYISPSVIIAAGPSDDVVTEFSENWLRVTFPVRPGDRRVLLASGRIEISALWLRGTAGPTVVLE